MSCGGFKTGLYAYAYGLTPRTIYFSPPFCLVGDEAIDVSRMTGIPYFYGKESTRGARSPMINLFDLTAWDRFRVAWALVAGYAVLASSEAQRLEELARSEGISVDGHEAALAALAWERNHNYTEGKWRS